MYLLNIPWYQFNYRLLYYVKGNAIVIVSKTQ